MHRLWYDLRTQAMFEEQFRPDVLMIDATLQEMIGRVVAKYAELAGRPLAVDVATTYALLDGVFEKALLAHLTGDESASAELRARVTQVLPRLLGGEVRGRPRRARDTTAEGRLVETLAQRILAPRPADCVPQSQRP